MIHWRVFSEHTAICIDKTTTNATSQIPENADDIPLAALVDKGCLIIRKPSLPDATS